MSLGLSRQYEIQLLIESDMINALFCKLMDDNRYIAVNDNTLNKAIMVDTIF